MRIQHGVFTGIIIIVSIYLVVWGIPASVPDEWAVKNVSDDASYATILDRAIPEEQLVEHTAIQEPVEAIEEAVPSDPSEPLVIQIKASGETTNENFEKPKEIVGNVFRERFGNSYQQAWEDQVSFRHGFDVPAGIADRVGFWVQVFGRYGKYQYLFHHKDNVGILYSILDLSHLGPEASGLSDREAEGKRSQALSVEKKRLKNILANLESKVMRHDLLDADEARIAALFARNPEIPISGALEPDKLRIQGGFAHRFRQAIVLSGKYMDEMENIFSLKGLPIELTRIPLVESAFNIKAVSSADAVGLWQFIPGTGKRYLKIDSIADERRDPILATYAAAAHLSAEYRLLGNWPMAINAYNTGPGRMMKARKQLGTDDIARIIRDFKDPSYQFYSSNYYPEFLAAVHVYDNQSRYFGDIKRLPPLRYDLFFPASTVNLMELARLVNVDEETIRELNPALAPAMLNGTGMLPPGYIVRVPLKMGPVFAQTETSLWQTPLATRWHVALEGETLASIARDYEMSVKRLEEINHYLPRAVLKAGVLIELPEDTGVALNPSESTLQ